MSTMGCGVLILALASVVVGFVPFLAWTNLIIAAPLAGIATIMAARAALKRTAQSADKAALGVALLLAGIVSLRLVQLYA